MSGVVVAQEAGKEDHMEEDILKERAKQCI